MIVLDVIDYYDDLNIEKKSSISLHIGIFIYVSILNKILELQKTLIDINNFWGPIICFVVGGHCHKTELEPVFYPSMNSLLILGKHILHL